MIAPSSPSQQIPPAMARPVKQGWPLKTKTPLSCKVYIFMIGNGNYRITCTGTLQFQYFQVRVDDKTVPFDFSQNGGVHKVGGQDVADEETEAL